MAQAITNICFVTKKQDCPRSYVVLDKTNGGDDADLWKDKMFRSKVRRYLCLSVSEDASEGTVITDIAFVGLKEQPPAGYDAVEKTMDTQEQALHKQQLCLQKAFRATNPRAITHLMLSKDDAYRGKQFTLAGEANGVKISYKCAELIWQSPSLKPRRAAPQRPSSTRVNSNGSGGAVGAMTRQVHDLSTSGHKKKAIGALDGIPFKLNEKLKQSAGFTSLPSDITNILNKNAAELLEENEYDFSKEKQLVFS